MIYSEFSGLLRRSAVGKSIQIWLEFCYQKADNVLNKTRQGYARKRILKPAGSSFVRGVL